MAEIACSVVILLLAAAPADAHIIHLELVLEIAAVLAAVAPATITV
jgi:hypothetical protein